MQHKCVCECVSAVGAGAAVGCVVDLLHDHGRLVADHFGEAKVLVGPGVMRISWQLKMDFCGKKDHAHWMGGTSRTQCPKAPNVTEELRKSVKFVSMTLRMAMSPMTGDEMVVTRRRMDAMKMKTTPILFQ